MFPFLRSECQLCLRGFFFVTGIFFFDLADLFQLCVVKMLSMLIIEYVIIQIQMEIAFRRIIV